jgi:tetratricopeptide (TPR) repeat protein
MKMHRLTAFFMTMIALFASALSLRSATEPDEIFASANRDFEVGKFAEASAAYLELANAGHISSELYFNLGTAQYRLGKTGEAVLWMRRALVVEPAMPEVRQNLEFLGAQIGYLEFAEGRFTRFLRSLPAAFSKWAIALALWTGLISLLLAFALERLRPNRSALVTLAIFAGIFAFVASRLDYYRATRIAIENFATITSASAEALTAPAPEARSVIKLPPGSEVRVIRESGQWRYSEIPGELRGWIRADALEPVWPLPLSRIKTTP